MVCPSSGRDGSEKPRSICLTGASTGIGLGIARAFLLGGDKVCIVSRNPDKAKEHKDIQDYASKGQVVFLSKDLTQPDSWKSTIEEAVKLLDNKLDVLINNAGFGKAGKKSRDITLDFWHEHFKLDLDAMFFLSTAAVPHLEKTKGSIVNISSIAGVKPTVPMFTYAVTKAGANMVTQMMGLELAEKGIRVNAINPGVISSEFFFAAGMTDSEEGRQKFLKESGESNPLGRVGDPADVASLALLLADNKAAGWITGQLHVLDGGTTLG